VGILMPGYIRLLQATGFGKRIRVEGPGTHVVKEGTPTMGGLLIVLAAVVPTLLWANLTNPYIWIAVFVTVGFGTIGFIDDYKKVIRKDPKGMSARTKFLCQVALAAVAALLISMDIGLQAKVSVPFFKKLNPNLGMLYVPFIVLVIVGASNAVNLTDGLDGLAIGPSIIAAGTYMVFAYLAGHVKIANYLQILYVPGAGELTIFCGAMAGAGIGFLWYNTYPAQVFMGDVGALALGGALGTIAVITRQEIVLFIMGGVFVAETVSVMLQVAYFKMTGGKRIFRMAPLHHHFELSGWKENQVVVRFWIITIMLVLVGLSTLKIR